MIHVNMSPNKKKKIVNSTFSFWDRYSRGFREWNRNFERKAVRFFLHDISPAHLPCYRGSSWPFAAWWR
jgi:hypothetical protein